MKTAAILLPASYPDALQPGEWTPSGDRVAIACPACGVCSTCDRASLDCIWLCPSPACATAVWLEIAGDRE